MFAGKLVGISGLYLSPPREHSLVIRWQIPDRQQSHAINPLMYRHCPLNPLSLLSSGEGLHTFKPYLTAVFVASTEIPMEIPSPSLPWLDGLDVATVGLDTPSVSRTAKKASTTDEKW